MTITAGREALKQALYMRRKKLGRAGRRKKHKPQSWLYPWATEKHYAAAIRAWLRPMMDYVHTYLKNNEEAILRGDSAALVRQDAIPGGSYRRLVKSLNGWFTSYLPDITGSGSREAPPVVFMGLGNIAETLNDFNSAQWQKSAKAELGVEFPMYEDWWPATKEFWQEQNYGLIRKLSSDYITQINQKTEQAVLSGWSVAQLAAEIRKIDNSIKQGRANLIARDQIGKLNEEVTQARMEQAGLTMYIWSTAQDERVRGNPAGHFPHAKPSHYLMEGLLCRWSDSTVYSEDGGKTWKPRPSGAVMLHPGHDIQCRCTALSYWDELVGDVDSVIAQEEGYEYDASLKTTADKNRGLWDMLEDEIRAQMASSDAANTYKKETEKWKPDLEKQTESWFSSISKEDQKQVYEYTRSDFNGINGELLSISRDRLKELHGDIKIKIERLDRAIAKYDLNEDIRVWRGENLSVFDGWDIGDTKSVPCFWSTSIDRNTSFHKMVEVDIIVPNGTMGAYIGQKSNATGENEFLLGRGLRYKMIAKERQYTDALIRVTLKVVKDE